MKKIYIDFDDVISRTAEIILDLVKDRYGITTELERITDFNLQKSFNLTSQQFSDLIALIHEPEVIEGLLPIDGAIQGIESLKKQKAEIAIVTGRPPTTKQSSLNWLNKHSVPYDSLTFVDKYNRFLYTDQDTDCISLDTLKTLSFDCAIEDSATMALFIANEMNIPVLLHDRPWNRHVPSGNAHNIQRCLNWNEIMKHIQN